MAGNNRTRLSPPLMHAFRGAAEARDAKAKLDLRDEAGERIIAHRRAAPRAAITEPVLRREVARDLDALMNTIALESTLDLEDHDYVRNSVLNFGFPDIANRTVDELAVSDIKDEIRSTLVRYEPRLRRGSIAISRDYSVDTAALKIRYLVHADLLCNPVNVPVEFVADVEVGSGKILITRL